MIEQPRPTLPVESTVARLVVPSGDKVYTNVEGLSAMRSRDAAKAAELVNPPKVFTLDEPDMEVGEAIELYDAFASQAKDLMQCKNHDYGEAWRDMRISSLTDLILQKLLRIKKIEDNKGKTLVSEGIDANYQDMINYSVFAMIHFMEAEEKAAT